MWSKQGREAVNLVDAARAASIWLSQMTQLHEAVGYGVVLGFGGLFALLYVPCVHVQR